MDQVDSIKTEDQVDSKKQKRCEKENDVLKVEASLWSRGFGSR